VAAERHDAGARPAEISQQKLEQRAAADDLRTVGMLRPRHGIGERCRSVGPGAREDGVGTLRNVSRGQPVVRSTISGVVTAESAS